MRTASRRDHLGLLESEAIHVFREVVAELEKPVLLFSGGKDSIVLVHLALKAFRPGRFPFPLPSGDEPWHGPGIHLLEHRLADGGVPRQ